MKLLLDTDVLIDVALNRAPFAESAANLLDELQTRPGMGFIAWHSAANFYYLVSSPKGKQEAQNFIRDLAQFVGVATVSTRELVFALSLDMTDFEDAMQVASAVSCGADYLVTRNIEHYRRSPVKSITPHAWLRLLPAS